MLIWRQILRYRINLLEVMEMALCFTFCIQKSLCVIVASINGGMEISGLLVNPLDALKELYGGMVSDCEHLLDGDIGCITRIQRFEDFDL